MQILSQKMEPIVITKQRKDGRFKSKESKKQKLTSDDPQSPVNWMCSPLLELEPSFDILQRQDSERKTSCSRASEMTQTTDCTETLLTDNNKRHASFSSRSYRSAVPPMYKREASLSSQNSTLHQLGSLKSSSSSQAKDDHVSYTSDNQLDDNSTIQSFGMRCRYCLSNETPTDDKLIAPCLCSGSSKYVHKTCLEKWLTLRNLSECEVCRTRYITEWIDRPMCSFDFPAMERRDIVLLLLTISFYITLIFQFLGVVYISTTTHLIKIEARMMTLIALSLGLFWFLIGSITLTIVLYTSEYWKKWRLANKRKVVVMDPELDRYKSQHVELKSKYDSDLGADIKVHIPPQYNLALAVPV